MERLVLLFVLSTVNGMRKCEIMSRGLYQGYIRGRARVVRTLEAALLVPLLVPLLARCCWAGLRESAQTAKSANYVPAPLLPYLGFLNAETRSGTYSGL